MAIRSKSALSNKVVRLVTTEKTVKVLGWLEHFDIQVLKTYHGEMFTAYKNRHDANVLVAVDVDTQKGMLIHIKEIEGYAANLPDEVR